MGWKQYFRQLVKPTDTGDQPVPEPDVASEEIVQERDAPTVSVAERLDAGRQAHREGKLSDAADVYRQVLLEDPRNADATHLLALISMQGGDLSEAEAGIRQAIALDSGKADFHSNLGLVLVARSRFAEAEACFNEALACDPGHLTALGNLSSVLLALQRPADAESVAKNLLRLLPGDLNGYVNLSAALMDQDRVHEAVSVVREGLNHHPRDLGLLMQLVSGLELVNQLDEAQKVIDLAEALAPDLASVKLLAGIVARRQGKLQVAEQRLRGALEQGLNINEQIEAYNQLGLTLDAMGTASEAFGAFTRSNQLLAQSVIPDQVNGRRFLQEVSAVQAFFSDRMLENLRTGESSDGGVAPVFFVGFPRSGTTLMEQILKTHPQLITTDEVSPLAVVLREIRNTGQGYPAYLANADTGFIRHLRQLFYAECDQRFGNLAGRRLVDKLPLNIIHLGLINVLFPSAKVIVALRDPRDVCLSCYMQKFRLNDAMVNFLDIESTARAYHAVMGLWLHYRQVLDIPWMEYRYEDLVTDFDGTVTRVLDFIGIEWNDAVRNYRQGSGQNRVTTPSYRDVAAPINNHAVARWLIYQQELEPILPVVSPYVENFGYQTG